MIDPKDLRELKTSEMQVGGVFYLKNDNGSFSMCQITESDLKRDGKRIRELTIKYAKENRLFVRINRPFQSFA
jgi:hypothetical protein